MSEQKQKIGAGHARAMVRAGFKEAAQVLPAFPPHSIQPVEEIGLAGNLTPQEIANSKEYDTMLGRYSSRGEQAQERQALERE